MHRGPALIATGAVIGLLAGLALSGPLRGGGASGAPASSAVEAGALGALAGEVAELRVALAEEREERTALAAEMALLRWAVEQRLPEPAVETEAAAAGDPTSPAEAAEREAPPPYAGFDESVLLEGGMTPDQVARLRERFEATEMEELFLRDRAVREGWARRPRMFDELRRIRMGLREEIGDEAYDLMLYATGRSNRVVLADVLATSPALEVGLRPGDEILRCDGQRVFSAADLRSATQDEEAAAPVALDVLRDGEELRVYLPRGPLGVRLRPARRAPEGVR